MNTFVGEEKGNKCLQQISEPFENLVRLVMRPTFLEDLVRGGTSLAKPSEDLRNILHPKERNIISSIYWFIPRTSSD